jgi:polyhydroxybutyrate depolymerase
MLRLLSLTLALILAVPAYADTIRLGDRYYEISLPSNPRGAPLLVMLHGGGGNPGRTKAVTGLTRVALRQGYAVAYPAGTGRKLLTWNAEYCCAAAARNGVDDDGFLARVIKDAQDRFDLGTRVYVTGMSNGSMMAQTFAARNPGLVRAVAGVAGSMDTASVRVAGPVPALIIHGTADPMVPYGGGRGENSLTRTDFASVASVVDAFLAPWGDGLARTSRKIDRRDDGTAVIVTDHVKAGAVVLRLMTVEGGGHNWPGGAKPRDDMATTAEIDANTEILRFFAMHP